MSEIIKTLFDPFPKQIEFIKAVLSGRYSFVLYGGGIRGGKSFAAIAILILLCKIFPRSRWAIVRKDMPTIEKNVFPTWDKIVPVDFVKKDARRSTNNPRVEFNNGSVIIFFAENYSRDKELDRFKGLEVNGFLGEEINELHEDAFNKMIERAGSYLVPDGEKQPPPIIFATCNPSPGWVKKKIYDPWKNGTLKKTWFYIQARIFDNTYISKEYLESLKTLPHYHYRVFVEGDWDFQLKVDNAYWRGFELDKHISNYSYDPKLPVHLSIDSNVLPYISVTIWQMPNEYTVRQIAEVTADDPDNSAPRAAALIVKWLNELRHEDLVILHGDSSTRAANTIDPEKRSFITLFGGVLAENFIVKNRVSRSNPSVSVRGEFINSVYEGIVIDEQGNKLNIGIDEGCKGSINDYITVVQDTNGGMQKRKTTKNGITFEPHGHLSDTKAYFIIDVWMKHYIKFKNAGSKHEYILNVYQSHNQL